MLSRAKVSTPLTPCSCVHLILCLAAVIAPHITSYLQVLPLQLSTRGFLHNTLTTLRSVLEETYKNPLLGIYILKVERCRAAGGSAHQNRFNPALLASPRTKNGVVCASALNTILLSAVPRKMRHPGVRTLRV